MEDEKYIAEVKRKTMNRLSIRKYITCCLDCTDRKVGCHSTCQKYISQKVVADEQKTIRDKSQQKECDANRFKINQCIKASIRKR